MGLVATFSAVWGFFEEEAVSGQGAWGTGAHRGYIVVHGYIQQRGEGTGWREMARSLTCHTQSLQLLDQPALMQSVVDRLQIKSTLVVCTNI